MFFLFRYRFIKSSNHQISKYYIYIFFLSNLCFTILCIFLLTFHNVILVYNGDINMNILLLFTEGMIIKYTVTCFTFKINIIADLSTLLI